MCEDQEEDSTLVDREGGRGEALPGAGFFQSTVGWGKLWRAPSRRVMGSDLCFSNSVLATMGREWIRASGRESREPGGFPGGAVVENLPANAGDMGSSPGLGRSLMLRSY